MDFTPVPNVRLFSPHSCSLYVVVRLQSSMSNEHSKISLETGLRAQQERHYHGKPKHLTRYIKKSPNGTKINVYDKLHKSRR